MSAEKKQKATDKEPVQSNANDAIVPVSTIGTKTTTDSSKKENSESCPLKFVRRRDITFPNPCIMFTACECRMVKSRERERELRDMQITFTLFPLARVLACPVRRCCYRVLYSHRRK